MDYQVETEKSLPKKGSTKSDHHKVIFSYAIKSLMVIAFAIVISASGEMIYQNVRYTPFVVDGESMYPTLNYDTSVKYSDRTTFNDPATAWKLGDFSSTNAVYTCDYCLMDTHASTLSHLERFDIVVTHYKTDYLADGTLKDSASLKVKRIIGLPGETVKFTSDGTLYIKGADESDFSLVEQSFLSYENNKKSKPLVSEDWYTSAIRETTRLTTYSSGTTLVKTLGEDEYYVVGDNRRTNCSSDSRTLGPIQKDYIVGKAVTIQTKCTYTPGTDPKKLWGSYVMPWNLELL